MSKGSGKKRSTVGLILDVILTLCTGGLWLIWILIRYLRNNSLPMIILYFWFGRDACGRLGFFYALFLFREKNRLFYGEE